MSYPIKTVSAQPLLFSRETFDLLLLDVDGTLREYKTDVLLPKVRERIALVKEAGIPIAFCTNQGGVGLRHWQETGGFGEPQNYPTEDQVMNSLRRLKDILEIPQATIHVCYAYQSKKTSEWSPTPPGRENISYWHKDWRKPSPNMLLDAIDLWGAKPKKTLMVGDSEEDEQAAAAAGCKFMWAKDFFGWENEQADEGAEG